MTREHMAFALWRLALDAYGSATMEALGTYGGEDGFLRSLRDRLAHEQPLTGA
jgi:hypothetical protein